MSRQVTTKAADGTYVFVAPSRSRAAVVLVTFLALAALVVGGVLTATARTVPHLVLAGSGAVCLVLCWTLLQARIPQRVTVKGAIFEIRREGRTHRFDLEDPGVDIRVRDGEIAFAHYLENWVVVQARDVDWKVFMDVVMHYQNNADFNAEARDQRFSR